MKKLLLLVLLSIFTACQDDDNNGEVACDVKLWQLSKNCNPIDSDQNCVYTATFGETAETSGSITVDESTYNFYTAKGATNDGSQCWDGTK